MEKDNQQYRYQLEHCRGDRRKLICPNCGHRTFVPYIDVETGEYVSTEVGRCDRENNCGYHKTPKDFFQETGTGPQKRYWFPKNDTGLSFRPSGYSTISQTLVEESMTRLAFNNFNVWLREHFDSKKAMEATLRYKVGGHTLWPGATVFWQIDQQSRVHTGNAGKRTGPCRYPGKLASGTAAQYRRFPVITKTIGDLVILSAFVVVLWVQLLSLS